MSGASVGRRAPKPCSAGKTLRRCTNRARANNVVLIDVDSENSENVIIVDVPESLLKKSRKEKKKWHKNVIYIDDDDDEDGIPDSNRSDGANNVNCTAGASSSRKSCPVGKQPAEGVDEECEFVQVNVTPVRLSKCKRTYSGKASAGYRFGLDSDSENDSSDDDGPDSELVEDQSGEVQEQWQKAFSRRRKDSKNSTSQVNKEDCRQNVEEKDETRMPEEGASCSYTAKFNNEYETGMHKEGGASCSDTAKFNNEDETRMNKEGASCSNTAKFNNEDDVPSPLRTEHYFEAEHADASLFDDHRVDDFSLNSILEECRKYKQSGDHPIFRNEETPISQPCPKKHEPCVEPDRSFAKETHKNIQKTAAGSVKEKVHLEPGLPRPAGKAKEMEKLVPNKLANHNATPFDNATAPVSNKTPLSKKSLGSGDDTQRTNHLEKRHSVPEIPISETVHLNEAKLREDDSVSNSQQEEDKDDQLHIKNGDTSIINEREKLKETDEYKRALEEELASRQKALQIQAEEAQNLRRLRKRKNAESMRLLDMERRQKQRVEEIRNTQKKDEEDMNMKELIRVEVRKELNKLEILCRSMASLLHSLGVRVGGYPKPLPQEVQAAYKRALLTFHPDRASRSDMRQQVESEEKFKLINRLKEKLPPSL